VTHDRVVEQVAKSVGYLKGDLPAAQLFSAEAEALVPRCDFLVTRETILKKLVTSERPQIVTPEELVVQLRAA
jgi:hypothetical protein